MASNNLPLIGFAHNAGKTLCGTAACESGLKRGKVRLLLLQEGISPSSRRKFECICGKNNVDVFVLSGYDDLGSAIGRPGVMVLGITDLRFSETIKEFLIGAPKKP